MPVLHQMQTSGNCYKVRLAARQLGIELALKDYGLHDGATRQPDFLAKNPNGRVPLLEFDDGRTLPESGAILWFLSENTRLLPADRWARAEVLQWMFFEQYSHEPYIAVSRHLLKHPGIAGAAERIAANHPRGLQALAVMEQHLAANDWLAADRYTIADIALYAYTHSAAEGGFDLAPYGGIRRWLDRVREQHGHIPQMQEEPGVPVVRWPG